MPYASQQDIIDAYGEDALCVIAERDGDGGVDAAAVDRALARAGAEIDAALRGRYAVPLAAVPDDIRAAAVDLARYFLAGLPGANDDEIRQRYEDARRTLDAYAAGRRILEAPAAVKPAGGRPGVLRRPGVFRGGGLDGFAKGTF